MNGTVLLDSTVATIHPNDSIVTYTWTTLSNILAGVAVEDIVQDRDGNIWLGTTEGLTKYNNGEVTHYTETDGMAFGVVKAVSVDSNGNIWTGHNRMASRFDGQFWSTFEMGSIPQAGTNNIQAIHTDHNGEILFGTERGEFYQMDGNFLYEGNSNISHPVTEILSDRENNIWVAAQSIYQSQDYVLAPFSGPDPEGRVVYALAIAGNGDVWAGTDFGVSYYNGSEWTTYELSELNFQSKVITTIAIDEEDNVWVGNHDGISKFDGTRWAYISSQDELVSNRVLDIFIDDEHNSWIGTLIGLSVILSDQTSIGVGEPSKRQTTEIDVHQISSRGAITFQFKGERRPKSLVIYDVKGKQIENLRGYTQSISWDVRNQQKGIYFLRALVGNQWIIKKFVLS